MLPRNVEQFPPYITYFNLLLCIGKGMIYNSYTFGFESMSLLNIYLKQK